MNDIKLFEPTNKDLRIEYPELMDIDEFRDLTPRELNFVWYFSNRTSPYSKEKNNKKKVELSIKRGFGENATHQLRLDYVAGKFPEKIRKAVDRMERFNPSARMKAKQSVEKIFDRLRQLVDVSPEQLNEMDLGEKSNYTNLAIKISENLPKIVGQLEQSFGIQIKKESFTGKFGNNGPSLMDILHMEDE
tara:strand:- start:7317 stop:7886 length:570 start_codon:yes stop_codon:yes gene_type:complete